MCTPSQMMIFYLPIMGMTIVPLCLMIMSNLPDLLAILIPLAIIVYFHKKSARNDEEMKNPCQKAFSQLKECSAANWTHWTNWTHWMPFISSSNVDVTEKKDSFVVEVDLPGMQKEEIKVEVEESVITISGDRSLAHKEEKDEEEGEEKVIIHGRHAGKVMKKISLPNSADMETILAKYENGVLVLVVQKKAECVKEKKTVDIE